MIRSNNGSEVGSMASSGDLEMDRKTEIDLLRQEIVQLRACVQRLGIYRFMAYRDELTGLPNRRYLNERFREECHRVTRTKDSRVSLILLDVDDLKHVNDNYGHSAGDELLIEVGKILEATVRRADLCFRLGGDEFAILLPNTGEDGVDRIVERLRYRLARAATRYPYPLSLSLGAASSEDHSPQPAHLVAVADEAMYAAKRRSKLRSESE